MKNGRNGAITAAIACVLSAPLVIAPYAAKADELSDLRANQELLQHRLDQLARRRSRRSAGSTPAARRYASAMSAAPLSRRKTRHLPPG